MKVHCEQQNLPRTRMIRHKIEACGEVSLHRLYSGPQNAVIPTGKNMEAVNV